jgi:hypothetical protein
MDPRALPTKGPDRNGFLPSVQWLIKSTTGHPEDRSRGIHLRCNSSNWRKIPFDHARFVLTGFLFQSLSFPFCAGREIFWI